MKYHISLLLFSALTVSAQDDKTPSQHYTEIKNSGYITVLKKQRSANLQRRDREERLRDYRLYQRDIQK